MKSSLKAVSKSFLGVDWGERRIGISFSPDGEHIFPREHLTSQSTAEGIRNLCAYIQEEKVDEVVFGLPLTLRGQEGAMAKEIKKIASQIREKTGVAIHFTDERHTTREAKTKEGSATFSRDSIAAHLILTAFLKK